MAIVFFHPQVREALKWLCGYQVMYSVNLSFYSVLETWWRGSEGFEGLHEEALYRRRRERQWSDLAVLCQRGSTVRTDDQSGHYKKRNVAPIGCFWPSRTSPNIEDLPCELVAGEGCIHEELLGLKFRISPHSFFQVPQSTSHFGLSNFTQSPSYLALTQTVKTGEYRSCWGAVLCCGGVGSAGPGQHRPGCVLWHRHHRDISGKGDVTSLDHHFVLLFAIFAEKVLLIIFVFLESEEGDWNWAVPGGSGGRQSQRKT